MHDQRALPEKKYFKIGEVADLVGVEPHVLRYWETQFPQVRPHKARSGHRLYRRREVETLLVIRELLHVQRFTIAGARQALRQPGGAQSLLPRFFDATLTPLANGASAAGTRAPAHDDAATLPPGLFDVTDEDGSVDDDGPIAEEIVEVEAHGLDADELRDALEREAAGLDEDVVEVGVEAEAAVEPAVRRPALSLPVPRREPAALSSSRRALLEDALASARAVLAVLDREENRARPQA